MVFRVVCWTDIYHAQSVRESDWLWQCIATRGWASGEALSNMRRAQMRELVIDNMVQSGLGRYFSLQCMQDSELYWICAGIVKKASHKDSDPQV